MKSDASSRLNTRVTALENAGGGSKILSANYTSDNYGYVNLSETIYDNFISAIPMKMEFRASAKYGIIHVEKSYDTGAYEYKLFVYFLNNSHSPADNIDIKVFYLST